jgi:hypothetical protein
MILVFDCCDDEAEVDEEGYYACDCGRTSVYAVPRKPMRDVDWEELFDEFFSNAVRIIMYELPNP